MFFLIGKHLIITEKCHEIVDFLNPTTKYKLNVPRASLVTGGLLQNCGGISQNLFYIPQKNCVVCGILNKGRPHVEIKMIEKRENAACVVLDQCTLWIKAFRKAFRLESFRGNFPIFPESWKDLSFFSGKWKAGTFPKISEK